MQNTEMLRGPDLGTLLRLRENSIRKILGKGTLSRNLTLPVTDAAQRDCESAESEPKEPLTATESSESIVLS